MTDRIVLSLARIGDITLQEIHNAINYFFLEIHGIRIHLENADILHERELRYIALVYNISDRKGDLVRALFETGLELTIARGLVLFRIITEYPNEMAMKYIKDIYEDRNLVMSVQFFGEPIVPYIPEEDKRILKERKEGKKSRWQNILEE